MARPRVTEPHPDMNTETGAEFTALRNLGPVSACWLLNAGVGDAAHLRRLGAVAAFRRVRRSMTDDATVSLNLLYALYGAIHEMDWRQIPGDQRAALLIELDAAAHSCSPRYQPRTAPDQIRVAARTPRPVCAGSPPAAEMR